jgi:hypothetical protein
VTAKGSCRYRERARYQQRRLLCDQPQRAGVASSHDMFYPSDNIFYRLGLRGRNEFEGAIASRAVPKMTYLPPIPIFGSFGGNQLFVASNAICPEARTTFGRCHSHGDSRAVGYGVAQGGNRSMARGYVAIHLNVNRACKTIFRRCVNELAELADYRIFY